MDPGLIEFGHLVLMVVGVIGIALIFKAWTDWWIGRKK